MEIKIQQQLETNNLVGDLNSKTASIDSSSMPFVFDMLSKSLYSNPIGAICREITSNCFDSHKEAGVTDFVKIIKGYDEEGHYIVFKDVGVGLSPERINNIYMNYFSSTKRNTNDLIGGFGLGSKTPLAYQDYFYITTVFNSIKYNYVFSKGETLPTLDLLETLNTEERNGTEIKIIIKNDSDVQLFKKELIKQCNYFDDVIFENWSISNDYKIYDLEYFKIRNNNHYLDSIHILLGKVAYPVDWEQINEYVEDVKSIDIPIAVKFNIGDFQVTPNREMIRYTEETKKLIGETIVKAYNEFVSIYESQTQPFENVIDYLKNLSRQKYVKFLEDEIAVPKEISNQRPVICTVFNNINFLYKLKEDLLPFLYINCFNILNGKQVKNNDDILNINSSFIYITNNTYNTEAKSWYYYNAKVFRKQLNFYKVKSKIKYFNDTLFIKSLKNKHAYLSNSKFGDEGIYFNLGESIKIYKALKTIRNQVENYFNKYEDLNEQQLKEFKDYKKENDASYQRKLNNKFLIKRINSSNHFEITEKDLDKYTNIIIYGFREDKLKLEQAYKYFCHFPTLAETIKGKYNSYTRLNSKKAMVIIISKQNEKYFKNRKNMTNVNNIYGDNKFFRKFASMLKIKQILADNQKYLTDSLIQSYSTISLEIANHFKELKNYYELYKDKDCDLDVKFNNNLLKELLDLAEEKNLFDPLIKPTIDLVEHWFKGIELIKYVDINEESLPFILKYLKENKKKFNLEYYQKYIEVIEPKNEGKTKQLVLTFTEEHKETKFEIITKNVA
jgi:hypothetical protein